MGDFHVKKIILPSGKAVEIVYFQAEGERGDDETLSSAVAAAAAPLAPGLEHCDGCGSDLVYPTDWKEAEAERWELELRCPNCGDVRRGTYAQDAVERFDATLNDGTEVLIDLLERAQRENMEEDVERFVAALHAGHIEPFDF
jgi:hypothetical protein